MLEQISTSDAPNAIGPYSQAILDKTTNTVSVSGQIAINPKTNSFDESQSIEDQTHQVLKNLGAILKKANSGPEKVLKVRVYLIDMKDFPKVNKIYGDYFANHKPARVTVGVSSLPLGAKLEIECEAKVLSK